jgi:hypothetical protein
MHGFAADLQIVPVAYVSILADSDLIDHTDLTLLFDSTRM